MDDEKGGRNAMWGGSPVNDTLRKPEWLKSRIPSGPVLDRVGSVLRAQGLSTVCQSARCPNIGSCWNAGTATFLLLGERCTRNCRFCAVEAGSPLPPDPGEPERIARAVNALGLRHVVVTSVTRDDLPDGGARHWASVVTEIRATSPGTAIEVLVPDFRGDESALGILLDARPDILGHNLETVPRLYPHARPGADFARSLELLACARAAGFVAKTGLMLGLGEKDDEVRETIEAARSAGVVLLTLGQYLRPTLDHLPVERYVTPGEFAAWREFAESRGFRHVESGPLVRSSFHAEEQSAAAGGARK